MYDQIDSKLRQQIKKLIDDNKGGKLNVIRRGEDIVIVLGKPATRKKETARIDNAPELRTYADLDTAKKQLEDIGGDNGTN